MVHCQIQTIDGSFAAGCNSRYRSKIVNVAMRAGDLFIVPISPKQQNVDFLLQDWRAAGLNVACAIKSQIATIENRLVIKSVGTLSPHDQAALEQRLREWLQL
jgi:mRNA interferase MazF